MGAVPSLHFISENLVRAEAEFLRVADAVPADHWKTCPGEGRWSAGELVCHLIQVERTIIKNAGKLLEHAPKPLPLSKRFHLPMLLVESRLISLQTPIPLDLSLICEKDEMLAELREVRQQTRAFLEERTKGKNLRKYHMPHPFLGTLNLCEWFQMIASHQVRHAKQMQEIAAILPKTVNNFA